jgi:hypothetical protein
MSWCSMERRRTCLALCMTLAIAAAARAHAEYVLAPLMLIDPTPGQGGTSWATDLSIFNASDEEWSNAGPFCFASGGVEIPAHSVGGGAICTSVGRIGLLFVVPDRIAEKVWFQLKLRERTTDCLSAGIDVPVIRERDMLRGASAVLDVPGDASRFRRTIRIHNIANPGPVSFRLRVFDRDYLNRPILETTFEVPKQGTIDGDRRLDEGRELPVLDYPWNNLLFELVPEGSDSRYWWSVSIVDNVTNGVRLFAPH